MSFLILMVVVLLIKKINFIKYIQFLTEISVMVNHLITQRFSLHVSPLKTTPANFLHVPEPKHIVNRRFSNVTECVPRD